jgi:hypothetical protein
MIKLKQSSPNPSGIRFSGDTTRSFSFRAVARPNDVKAKVTYSIESAGAVFSHNSNTSFSETVDILAAESTITKSLGFAKTGTGTVLQVVVKARADEVGGASGFDVFWVVPVLQASAKAAELKSKFLGVLAGAASAESMAGEASVESIEVGVGTVESVDAGSPGPEPDETARYPLDRLELERARRVLQTLQAAVDAALATDSPEFEDLFDAET